MSVEEARGFFLSWAAGHTLYAALLMVAGLYAAALVFTTLFSARRVAKSPCLRAVQRISLNGCMAITFIYLGIGIGTSSIGGYFPVSILLGLAVPVIAIICHESRRQEEANQAAERKELKKAKAATNVAPPRQEHWMTRQYPETYRREAAA